MQQSYTKFIERILLILKSNIEFSKQINQFRFGDISKEDWGDDYPLCYVTVAKSPEVRRLVFAPNSNTNELPVQKRELEFWVIIVINKDTEEDTQKELYNLTNSALSIFEKNIKLKNPASNDDALCATSTVYVQGRLERNRGKLLEAMTVRIRPVTFF